MGTSMGGWPAGSSENRRKLKAKNKRFLERQQRRSGKAMVVFESNIGRRFRRLTTKRENARPQYRAVQKPKRSALLGSATAVRGGRHRWADRRTRDRPARDDPL